MRHSNAQWWLISVAMLIGAGTGSLATGGELHTLRFASGSGGNPASATCLAVSPRSDELLLGTSQGKFHFIEIRAGNTLQSLADSAELAAYSADGSRVLIKTQQDWRLLQVPSRQEVAVDAKLLPGVVGLTFNQRNGKLLVSQLVAGGPAAESGKIALGDELTGCAVGSLGKKVSLIGQSVSQVKEKLTGLPNTTIRLFLIPKGGEDEQVVELHRRAFRAQGLSGEFVDEPPPAPDNFLAAVVWETPAFVSAKTGRFHAAPTPQTVAVDRQRALTADFQRYAILGSRVGGGRALAFEVFDVAKMTRLYSAPFPLTDHSMIRFSPDGKWLFIGSLVRVDAFDAETGRFSHGYPLDGTRVTTIEDVKPIRSEEPTGSFSPLRSVRQTTESRIGASVQYPKARAVKFAVSSGLLATADANGQLLITHLESGAEVQRFPAQTAQLIEAVEFTPDGKWLIFYRPGKLHLVEVASFGSTADNTATPAP